MKETLLSTAILPSLYSTNERELSGYCAGEVMFGTDSHTCNAGAFGQFASGIGNTDAGFILGTGKLLIKVSICSSSKPIYNIALLLRERLLLFIKCLFELASLF